MLAVGDLHYTKSPPGTRAPGYQLEIQELLTEAFELAAENRVDALALAGDIFHSKGNTTHTEVASLGEVLRHEKARTMVPRVLAIPGNHDMQGNNLTNAQFEQPYAVLARTGCYEDITLRATPEAFSAFEAAVHGIPFGAALNPPIIAAVTRTAITSRGGGCLVLLTHHELSVDGSVGSSGPKFVQAIMQELGRPVVVINGHLHLEPSIVPVAAEAPGSKEAICGFFVQIGTMARTSPGDSDTAAACLVDFDFSRPRNMQLGVQLIKLHNLPRSEAFVLEAPTIEGDKNMDAFIASLKVNEEKELDPTDLVRQAAALRSPAPRPQAVERAVQLVGECR